MNRKRKVESDSATNIRFKRFRQAASQPTKFDKVLYKVLYKVILEFIRCGRVCKTFFCKNLLIQALIEAERSIELILIVRMTTNV